MRGVRRGTKCKIQIPDEAVTKQHRHPDLIIYVIFLSVGPCLGNASTAHLCADIYIKFVGVFEWVYEFR